jgi:hypothetical protein
MRPARARRVHGCGSYAPAASGGKWRLTHATALGRQGSIEVDVKFHTANTPVAILESWSSPSRMLPSNRKYGNMARMKTTIEIPDPLFRRAKSRAAERGQTLKQLVAEALEEKLGSASSQRRSEQPPWMRGFGKLRRLRKETARIQAKIDEVFEVLEPEDRA